MIFQSKLLVLHEAAQEGREMGQGQCSMLPCSPSGRMQAENDRLAAKLIEQQQRKSLDDGSATAEAGDGADWDTGVAPVPPLLRGYRGVLYGGAGTSIQRSSLKW